MHSTYYACGHHLAGVRGRGISASRVPPLAKRRTRGGDIWLYASGPLSD